MILVADIGNTSTTIGIYKDKELLNKWLNLFGFELNVILQVVKNLKNKKIQFLNYHYLFVL